MANKSDWKGFEKIVAEALGGKRRFRTTESYGKEADDVLFPKNIRKTYPKVNRVAIECKKRKGTLNIHAFFAEAKSKYAMEGKRLIFASKITKRGSLGQDIEDYISRLVKRYCKKHKCENNHKTRKHVMKKNREKIQRRVAELRCSHDITALVTVELDFFKELFLAWRGIKRFPRRDDECQSTTITAPSSMNNQPSLPLLWMNRRGQMALLKTPSCESPSSRIPTVTLK